MILSNKVNGFGVWDLGPTALQKVLILTRSILEEYFLKENQNEVLLRYLSLGFDKENEIPPFIRDTEKEVKNSQTEKEDRQGSNLYHIKNQTTNQNFDRKKYDHYPANNPNLNSRQNTDLYF